MNKYCNSIELLMHLNGITVTDLAAETALSESTIYKIIRGFDNLYFKSIEPVADHFNIPFDIFLGRNLDRYEVVSNNGIWVLQYTDKKNMDVIRRLIEYQRVLDRNSSTSI